jgi:CubicO group peptidase (beta-lactamase class C family)
MNQFGHALTRVAEEPMEVLFKRRVADPIGMNPSQWDWGDEERRDGVVVNGGSGNRNRHMFISAREFARFGHLFLNRGKWRGKQLIPAAWVAEVTSVRVPADLPLGHLQSNIDGRGCYGLNWWVNGLKADGQRKWPGAPVGTFAASGHNNNKLFVIPEWGMVVVRLGLDQRDGRIGDDIWGEFIRKLGEAMDNPDP